MPSSSAGKEKYQSCIDSFFGGGSKVKKQKRIESFFGSGKKKSESTDTPTGVCDTPQKTTERKEEPKNGNGEEKCLSNSPANTISTSSSTPDSDARNDARKRIRCTDDAERDDDDTTTKNTMDDEKKENNNNDDGQRKKKKQRGGTCASRRVIDDDDSSDDDGDDDYNNDDEKDDRNNDEDEAMDEEILKALQEEGEEDKNDPNEESQSKTKSRTKRKVGKREGESKGKTTNKKNKNKNNIGSDKAREQGTENLSMKEGKPIQDKTKDEQEDETESAALLSSSSLSFLSLAKQKKLPKSVMQKALKGQIKTDLELLTQDPSLMQILTDTNDAKNENTATNIHHLLQYSVLCDAFEQIEAITARLQIQDIFTTLLRKTILRTYAYHSPTTIQNKEAQNNTKHNNIHQDLYSVLYLASNTVAPAYKCIELGIGDAILIKAISEAYGTNPKTVKQKYEEEGDLGSAAKSFKNKQKTLGGFFTKTTAVSNNKKKVGLTCQEVLTTFREIALIKGNQSQKLKSDKIKKLLVRVSSPQETKYIIRGLQGKLRIGLAQSTVLISLGHALAITLPPQTIMNDHNEYANENQTEIDTNKKERESLSPPVPEEVNIYRNKKIPIDKRLEAVVSIIKKAYCEVPSYDILLDTAFTQGVPLHQIYKVCTLTPGIPVTPMLAKPTKSIQEVFKRLNGVQFTCEYKYDGERAQIHMYQQEGEDAKTKTKTTKTVTKVFSRNLLDTSEKYPEVPLFVQEAIVSQSDAANNKSDNTAAAATTTDAVTSFVLDAEVVAYNNKTKQLVPFQVLSTRKQKEESAETAKVQVIVQAFDLMYLNGKSLLNYSLKERRNLLYKYFKVVPGKFQFAVSIDYPPEEDTSDNQTSAVASVDTDGDVAIDDNDKTKEIDSAVDCTTNIDDTSAIEEFLDKAIKGQCEGLMIKTLNSASSIYEPSRRSLNWLKLKKDYLEGSIGDSIDLVPIGAFYGKGKRTGVYGAYLLACYDADTEQFQSVCKIGTGFSDEDLQSLADTMKEHIIPKKSPQYNVSDVLKCDVWFDTVTVWEIKAADLSTSSVHRGAEGKIKGENSNANGNSTSGDRRGIGLRFPRFERIRKDKKPEEATSSDQILEMYYKQDTIDNNDDDDDDDIGI